MERVTRIRERLQAEGADVFLISNPVNRRYPLALRVLQVWYGSQH